MKVLSLLVPAVATAILAVSSAYAEPIPVITIQVDENGNSMVSSNFSPNTFSIPSMLQSDPGPGGLSHVLTYGLEAPFLTTGDVLLYKAGTPSSMYEDVIRFNASETCGNEIVGCLLFYSAPDSNGFDSLADTPSAPTLYSNTASIVENDGGYTTYTPSYGQPGFFNGADFQVTYEFLSGPDNSVPEPATLAVFGAGLAGFAAFRRRKAKKA